MQKYIDQAAQGGATVVSVSVTAKVYEIDDHGALVVYAQITGVSVKLKGGIGVASALREGPKFALGVIVK